MPFDISASKEGPAAQHEGVTNPSPGPIPSISFTGLATHPHPVTILPPSLDVLSSKEALPDFGRHIPFGLPEPQERVEQKRSESPLHQKVDSPREIITAGSRGRAVPVERTQRRSALSVPHSGLARRFIAYSLGYTPDVPRGRSDVEFDTFIPPHEPITKHEISTQPAPLAPLPPSIPALGPRTRPPSEVLYGLTVAQPLPPTPSHPPAAQIQQDAMAIQLTLLDDGSPGEGPQERSQGGGFSVVGEPSGQPRRGGLPGGDGPPAQPGSAPLVPGSGGQRGQLWGLQEPVSRWDENQEGQEEEPFCSRFWSFCKGCYSCLLFSNKG